MPLQSASIIRKGWEIWDSITDPGKDAVVRDLIESGYIMRWGSDPTPSSFDPNHPSAILNADFVDEHINLILPLGRMWLVTSAAPVW
jgi:hypothetical protein